MSRPVALVTGARRGIGLAVAEALGRAGFDLAITDLQDDGADVACDRIGATGAQTLFVASDVGDLDDHDRVLDAVIERFGRLDCLVNNAGIASPIRGDLLELTPENFDRVIAVNLRGTVFFAQNAARRMLAVGPVDAPRCIIHITSVNAAMASCERADYCISKAGLAMWSKSLALRLADKGVAVFDVRPGIIQTDMTAKAAEKYDGLIAEGLVPARRWGTGGDVGRVVSALARGDFGFSTGGVIEVDGALSVARF